MEVIGVNAQTTIKGNKNVIKQLNNWSKNLEDDFWNPVHRHLIKSIMFITDFRCQQTVLKFQNTLFDPLPFFVQNLFYANM